MLKSTLGYLSVRTPRGNDRGLAIGLDIVEYLIGSDSPRTLADISAHLNIPAATLYRSIRIMETRGYVARAIGGGYTPTSKLHEMFICAPANQRLLASAQSLMQSLCETVSQSCNLAIPSGGSMIVIAQNASPGPFGISIPVGFRYDVLESAPGLVHLTFSRNNNRFRWNERMTNLKDDKWASLNAAVQQVTEQGYSQYENPCMQSVTDLSCPVFDGSHLLAVLTIPYIRTVDSLALPATLAALLRTADQLNSILNTGAMVA